ncbi:hypothetical protein [Mesorhizobium argentiipisi]
MMKKAGKPERSRSKHNSGTGGRRYEWEGRMAGQSEPATEITPGAPQ